MPKLVTFFLIYFVVLVLIAGIPVATWIRMARLDRRRIMADGTTAQGRVTKVSPSSKHDQVTVEFGFDRSGAAVTVAGRQITTLAATQRLGLMPGSSVTVHYLPKWPTWGFIPALTYAERYLGSTPVTTGPDEAQANKHPLFYVSYLNPNQSPLRWMGGGDVLVLDQTIRFTAFRRRRFWFPKLDSREFPMTAVVDVEHYDKMVRFTLIEPDGDPRRVQVQAVSAADAETLAKLLPETKTAKFAPVMTEGAEFLAALSNLTPKPYVTPALVGANVVMFVIVVALGGGLIKPNPEAMINLGTDYTPLTLGGQWWRLLSSMFLHFGLFHLAFNMWALYVNGRMAERIYGSARYLVIYLVAGLAGSVASLLWHPIVNGAGASGAIFGILGALLAFFVKREGGVPASVIKAQRNSAMIFIAYNLLNGARIQGIDNAAHLGGLIGGFVMGYLLSRPLVLERNQRPWTRQWVAALGLVGGFTGLIVYLFSTGQLAPRQARDSQGHPIPMAGLVPAVHSLGGFQIGMTPEEIRKAKGAPLSDKSDGWVYNAIDNRHDGVLTVYFGPKSEDGVRKTVAVEFSGHDRDSAPPEVPYLNSLETAEVIRKYGEPRKRKPVGKLWEYLWFQNGIWVYTMSGTVSSYGIYDVTRLLQ